MKFFSCVLALAFCLPIVANAQEQSEEKSKIIELSYMKVKVGMEAKFEKAVKAHNEKFHKEGVYSAELYAITTGKNAGWYVWAMGSFTFSDLDSRPNDDAHQDDWNKNIAPFVAEYGRVEYWKRNMELTHQKEVDEAMISVWFLDIERGEYYRFNSFMKNVNQVYTKNDRAMSVYSNEFFQSDGRDIALVWPIVNWAQFDNDDWSIKAEYDKEFGEGSWENGLEEWGDFLKNMDSELWRIIK